MHMKMLLCASAIALAAASPTFAATLKWARTSDAQTLDPHAYNEGFTHTLNRQMYETLVERDDEGKLQGVLATQWGMLPDDPSTWEFKLRPGVTFHDGTPFEADDVVFSIQRAQSETSNMRSLVTAVESVEAVDPLTVRMHTTGVSPLLVNNLVNVMMMNREWSLAHGAEAPQDHASGEESYAAMHENGTGAYELVSRVPDSRTEMKAYDGYWGKGQFPLAIDDIIYTPIQAAATRVSALLSGDINFLQDVPAQDIQRLEQSPGIHVVTGPENRTIFFGMNIGDAELTHGEAKGNPFADVRVRRAMNMSIDRTVIQKVVMRGQSRPLGTIAPPFINGYRDEMGELPKVDLEQARALMAEAGYPNGFAVTLQCTNDAFINEEGICQSLVGMLARIGIDVRLDVQPGGVQFGAIAKGDTSFYVMGWGVSTFDSQYMFDNLVHSRSNGRGAWASINYQNPDLDAKIESLASEGDLAKRDKTIAEIWDVVQDQVLYLPIHLQMLARAMSDDLVIAPNTSNSVSVKKIEVKG